MESTQSSSPAPPARPEHDLMCTTETGYTLAHCAFYFTESLFRKMGRVAVHLHFSLLVPHPINANIAEHLLKYIVMAVPVPNVSTSAFNVKDFLYSLSKYELILSDLALETLTSSEAFNTFTLAIDAAISICKSSCSFFFLSCGSCSSKACLSFNSNSLP